MGIRPAGGLCVWGAAPLTKNPRALWGAGTNGVERQRLLDELFAQG
ncbi:MAG: hypothetical protein ACI9GK_002071 [Devosia sp.]|jgi:hypothetical protein